MPRLAVFDLDGTLVDSLADLHASVNHALAAVGLPPRDEREVRGFVGEGARVLLERAVAPRAELVEPALAAWHAHYAAHLLDRTVPFPGIPALLDGSRRALAVHTNKPGALARRILEGLGLAARFGAGIVGGDDAPRKPDPTGVLEIMARAGATAAETVFIGDSRSDLWTARAAGVEAVLVSWGLVDRADLVALGAPVIVDRVEELAPYLA